MKLVIIFFLVDRFSTLFTSTFGIDATRQLGKNQALKLSVQQPLKIESGQATLTFPTSREK